MLQMKKTGAVLLAMVLLMALLPAAGFTAIPSARAETDGDWTYTVSNGEATITKYSGKAASVTIPSKLGGNTVTRIGTGFSAVFTKTLKSVIIPDSVTGVSMSSFEGCTGLTSVTIGKKVTVLGDSAFKDCTALTKINIPDSVTRIGWSVFENCTKLTGITLSQNLSEIEPHTFRGCTGLTGITIGGKVTKIGTSAFEGCTSLTGVALPDSVTSIGSFAFKDCAKLVSVYLGNGVAEVGLQAFKDCLALTSVTVPNNAAVINSLAFEGCEKVTLYCNENSAAHKMAKNFGIPFSFKVTDAVVSVTFHKNGGSGSMAKQIYLPGSAQTLTANAFTRKGYVFAGWAASASGKVKHKDGKSIKISKNTTLYAVWTKVTAPSKAVTSLKLTSPKTKQLKVTYKAVSGAAGYRIEYSTNSKFTKATTKTVHTTKLTYTIKSLKAKTKYYVRVTAYKTDSAKAKVYSSKTASKNLATK